MFPLIRTANPNDEAAGTPGDASAGVWEIAFSAVVFFSGLVGSGLVIALLIVPEWRVTQQFFPTACQVLDARLGTIVRDDQTLYRAEILIEYSVQGQTHRVWTYDIHTARGNGYVAERADVEAVVRQYGPGGIRQTTCWYDPLHPEVAVLVRGYRWWVWLVLSIPLSLLLIGSWGLIVGLWRRGKSAERLAVRGVPLEVLRLERRHRESEYPFVPEIRPSAISPGQHLLYRLPPGTASVRAPTAWLVAALFWNAMLAALVATAFLRGPLQWSFPIFVIPCGAIAIALPAVYIRQRRLIRAMGRTVMEISHFPLVTGGRFQIYVTQTGQLRLQWFEVLLVCEEEAIFQHGTNLRRESRRIWQKTLLRHEKLEIMPHVPFECQAEFRIPPGAMHSFQSDHNEVRWRLCVRVSAEHRPVFERIFPLVVLPGLRQRGEGGPGPSPAIRMAWEEGPTGVDRGHLSGTAAGDVIQKDDVTQHGHAAQRGRAEHKVETEHKAEGEQKVETEQKGVTARAGEAGQKSDDEAIQKSVALDSHSAASSSTTPDQAEPSERAKPSDQAGLTADAELADQTELMGQVPASEQTEPTGQAGPSDRAEASDHVRQEAVADQSRVAEGGPF